MKKKLEARVEALEREIGRQLAPDLVVIVSTFSGGALLGYRVDGQDVLRLDGESDGKLEKRAGAMGRPHQGMVVLRELRDAG
jgi:hypothetical protein